jgi:hypothetical protein
MSFVHFGSAGSFETPGLELYLAGSAGSAAPSGAATDAGPDAIGLSPDALLAYCQARLDSIDGQTRGIFKEQELRNSESSAIQSVLATFQGYTSGVNDDQQACTAMETSLSNLIKQLQQTDPGCPELGKLMQTFNDLRYSGTGSKVSTLTAFDEGSYPAARTGPEGDCTLSTSEIQGFISNIQNCASDLNSDSELQMIQLQSLMSQRQTEVQLTTNLVQSLGDQAEKVAENIGH